MKKISVLLCIFLMAIFVLASCYLNEDRKIDNTSVAEENMFEDANGPVVYIGAESVTRDMDYSSKYVTVTQTSSGKYTAEINLRPKDCTYYKTVNININATGTSSSGWKVHVGNSPTNNGYGGDAGTTQYDSEMQLFGNDLSVYKNDYGGNTRGLYRANWDDNRPLSFAISDNKFTFSRYMEPSVTYDHSNIFEISEKSDYMLYAGFNRTYYSLRYGTGVSYASIRLSRPVPEVWIIATSISNMPGSYTAGHMALALGYPSLGWYVYSIERPEASYVLDSEIIWKKELSWVARQFSDSGYSCLYSHREDSKEKLLAYLKKNAPGVDNGGIWKVGDGYDRIASLKDVTIDEVNDFKEYLDNCSSFKYNLTSNNCASWATRMIDEYFGVDCDDRSIDIPNNLFDDLYDNSNFIIERD